MKISERTESRMVAQWTANVADHGEQGVDLLPEGSSVPTV